MPPRGNIVNRGGAEVDNAFHGVTIYYVKNVIYTDKSNAHFFEDTVLEVAERNMWVMEIKYFEFYCKFYYFYEHL